MAITCPWCSRELETVVACRKVIAYDKYTIDGVAEDEPNTILISYCKGVEEVGVDNPVYQCFKCGMPLSRYEFVEVD